MRFLLASMRRDEVLGRLLAHPFQVGERRFVEPVEVGQASYQPPVDELLDQLDSQAVDVHRVAVGEPADPLLELFGTARWRVRAVKIDLAGRARPGHRSSGRSSGKRTESRCRRAPSSSTRTTCGMISPAFWITTVSPTRMSLRAISSALCRRGPLDGRAGQGNGRQVGDGRQLARLARPGR